MRQSVTLQPDLCPSACVVVDYCATAHSHRRGTGAQWLWVVKLLVLLSACGSAPRVKCVGPRDISCSGLCVYACLEDDAGLLAATVSPDCATECRGAVHRPGADGGIQ